MKNYNKIVPKSLILTAFFFIGSFSIITQTILLRELMVVALGNEIIFGISFTHWLIGIFAGAVIGGYISDKTKKVLELFAISTLILCLLTPIAITLVRILYSLSHTPLGTYINFLKVFLYSALIIIPLSFFIGFLFPIASKLFLIKKDQKKTNNIFATFNISQVYIYEAIGSLFCGCLYSFVLIEKFNPYFIIELFALPLLVVLAIITFRTKHFILLFIILVRILFNILSLTPLTPLESTKVNRYMIQKRWQSFSNTPLISSTDSKYQNIALGKSEDQFNLFTNGQLTTTFPEDNDNMILSSHIISQHKNPQKILIIGEAISGLAKHLLKFNVKKVLSVEIDPVLIKIIKKNMPHLYRETLNDKRFFIQIQDGRKFVKNITKKSSNKSENSNFDIVFLNMPEPSTLLLNRYYTLEFFQDVSKVLTTNGIFALQITSSENYAQGVISDYTVSIYNTLKKVFPHIVIAPGLKNFFFVSKDPANISDSPEILAMRYRNTGVKPKKLAHIFKSIYPEEKTKFIKNALSTHRKKFLNTDKKPISTFYYNKILGWYSGRNLENFFRTFENINLKTIGLLIFILVFIRFLFIKIKKIGKKNAFRFNTLISVIVGGFAGISLELLIIFSFQNIFGYIYHLIGFIIALFMFGLPLGAFISIKILSKNQLKKKNQLIFLLCLQVIIAIVSLIFPHIINISNEIFLIKLTLFLFTVIIGILVGSIFPIALNLYIKESEAGKAAGIIDASDHLGAAIGAFFTGTIFLPILGIIGSSYLLTILALASALLLLTDIFQIKN